MALARVVDGPSRPGSPGRASRSLVVVVLGAMLAALLPGLTPLATPAQAAPGAPGVPDAPVELYHEGFGNGLAPPDWDMLDDYVGAGGTTYTADPEWIDLAAANGIVLSADSDDPGSGHDASLKTVAAALGAHNGSADPDENFAVSAWTDGDPGANRVQFATVDPLPIAATNRFLTFSVNAAAFNCASSHPLLRFYLDDGGTEIPVGTDAIDPCTMGAPVPGVGASGIGTFASDGSILFTGTELGIVMRNEQASGAGNDGGFDDIRVLDATPQLDKEFTPTDAPVGAQVDLVFTITNTSELAAKAGWSFTDTLADGLVVADPDSATTTCTNGTVLVTGGDTIAVSGDLDAGQASCTASVPVLLTRAGTFPNDAGNISDLVGIDPPGASQVTSTDLPSFDCSSTAFLSQGAPSNLYEVDVITGDSEVVATDYYPENINAIGFNPLDGYIYGWVTSGPVDQRGIARVGADHEVQFLGYPTNWDDFPLGASHHIGDFDDQGHLWLSNGVGGYWVEIDLAPGSPTYMQVLDTDVHSPPLDGYSFADWGFNPSDGVFYTTAGGPSDNKRLWSFDPDTGVLADLADLGNVVDGAFGGAVYSDANNNLFTSNNASGEIWHVRLPDGPASFLADGPAASVNDGAICFNVILLPLGPVIDLTKTAEPSGPLTPGGTVQYTVTATNAGNLAGFDVLVEDPLPDGIDSGTWTCEGAACPAPSGDMPLAETIPQLGIGESLTYTIDAAVADDPPAEVVNTATVTGPEVTCGDPAAPTPPPCQSVATNGVLPLVTVDKTADVELASGGDTITYEVEVANVGQGALDGELVVADPLVDGLDAGTWTCAAVGGAVCPNDDGTMPLAETVTDLPAGSSLTYTIAAVVAEDPPAEILNVASVEGPVTCQGDPVTAPPCEDSVAVVGAQPSLALVKTAEVLGGDGRVADVGDTIRYVLAVTNTGNVAMSGVAVDDPLDGLSTVVCPLDTLAAGQTMRCTAQYVVTQADVDAGGITNTATVSGIPPDGTPVSSAPAESVVQTVDPRPMLALEKLADANGASEPGDEITYRFVVTNTGNVTLRAVEVDDPTLGSVTCPDTDLAPAASVTCTGDDPYVVSAQDHRAGEVVNVATATAQGPAATGGAEVRSESTVVITALRGSGLAVTGGDLAMLLLAAGGLLLAGIVLVAGGQAVWPGGGPPGPGPRGGAPRRPRPSRPGPFGGGLRGLAARIAPVVESATERAPP